MIKNNNESSVTDDILNIGNRRVIRVGRGIAAGAGVAGKGGRRRPVVSSPVKEWPVVTLCRSSVAT